MALTQETTLPRVRETLAWRTIDLEAIRHNVRVLRARSAPAQMMVVVKADAYAHGAVAVARAAIEAGADRLGVAVLAEALELRSAGISVPILAWLASPGSPYGEALRHDIDLGAHSRAQLDDIADAAERVGTRARIHLKAETGMWRGGAPPAAWPDLVRHARGLEERGMIQVEGVWSHLACADTPDDPSVDDQLRQFDRAVSVAREAGLRPALLHVANSAATVARPDAHYDMVRCGLAVYGANPFADRDPDVPLRAAMTVKACVTTVKDAPVDAGVSYGHTFRTTGPTTLAVVPIGYADGMPPTPGQLRPAGRNGTSYRIAGRVCMDQFVLESDETITLGDAVTLLGSGVDGEFTTADWAAASGRSRYEILTGFGKARVPLRYEG